MIRFTVFDRWGRQTGVLNDVIEAVHKDEVNGEDSLTVMLASCDLVKGDRIVWRDKFGEWHEHIVNDMRDVHEEGKLYTVAYCENSIAELYTDYVEEKRPYNTTATVALQRALETSRWQVGTVTVTGTGSASLYHTSAREAITEIIGEWGGEFTTTITVEGTVVVSRKVNLLARRGRDNGKRFEWTKDVEGIAREVSAEDVCTALYGYGKGLEAYDDDGNLTGGYERKLTFGDINGGRDYVTNENAKQTWGLPDGKGGIKHTFGRVEFPDCEDMAELKRLTEVELARRCEPQVSYTANVVDLADAGYEFEDVRTGDTVALIDHGLDVRVEGRATCVERYLFNERATVVTLGNVAHGISDVIGSTRASVADLQGRAGAWDNMASLSEAYMNRLISNLNGIMNESGGYVYYEPGEGITTYDKPKDQNPTMAVQIRGAGIRIANGKKSNGDWNWRTFGTGAGFTADEIVAGTISDAMGRNRWNLITGALNTSYMSATDITATGDLVSVNGDVKVGLSDGTLSAYKGSKKCGEIWLSSGIRIVNESGSVLNSYDGFVINGSEAVGIVTPRLYTSIGTKDSDGRTKGAWGYSGNLHIQGATPSGYTYGRMTFINGILVSTNFSNLDTKYVPEYWK